MFDHCTDQSEHNLARFLVESLRRLAEVLALSPTFHVQSDAHWNLGPVEHAGQWALRIAECLGARSYLNPAGGAGLFRPEEFEASALPWPSMSRYWSLILRGSGRSYRGCRFSMC